MTFRIATALALTAVVCVGGVLIALLLDPLSGVDHALFAYMTTHRDVGTARVVSAVSDLFGPVAVTAATLVVAAIFAMRRDAIAVGTVLGAVTLAGIGCEGLKLLVGRPRPPYVGQLVHETGYSYPSGHVSGSTALLVAVALAGTASAPPARRRIAVAAALLIAAAVAMTRLYLQVHWASDVLAALALGIAAALAASAGSPVAVAAVAHRRRGRAGVTQRRESCAV